MVVGVRVFLKFKILKQSLETSWNQKLPKILIAAAYSEVELETTRDFQLGKTNKEPAYLEKFPLGQMPALETTDGKRLTESSAIMQYIAEQKKDNYLLGQDPWERSQILKFTLFGEAQIMPEALKLLYMIFDFAKKDQEAADKAYSKLELLWGDLDRHLKGRNFLVADRLTLADIDIGCVLVSCFEYLLHPEIRFKFPELVRYFKSIIFLPYFQTHLETIRSEDNFAKKPPSFS